RPQGHFNDAQAAARQRERQGRGIRSTADGEDRDDGDAAEDLVHATLPLDAARRTRQRRESSETGPAGKRTRCCAWRQSANAWWSSGIATSGCSSSTSPATASIPRFIWRAAPGASASPWIM